ncbi:hypothetical protein LRP30_30095 [Bradyrhizobium sp. C-145]|uniref:hypothetical protein n=1 Tax=Bradyrhizobium sp. C-145 TaxID=574727 RepID=UPI00201B6EC5|nr:hypothetical protein [Bradyrhizobium sp. C-145]UQR61196.1 hypothetical protein LRP30_30095 [Bradyrhizobium sp. C-145]
MNGNGKLRMMDVIDQASASELPPVLHKSSRRFSWILAIVVISFGLCAGAAYYWTDIEAVFATSSVHEAASKPGLPPEDREALSEIRLGQQMARDELAELNRNIGAQQADLKRMADQIEALTAKIESLQNIPVPASVLSAPSPPAAHPTLRPAKRVVQPSKPEGPISVGGAPLIPEPGSDQR